MNMGYLQAHSSSPSMDLQPPPYENTFYSVDYAQTVRIHRTIAKRLLTFDYLPKGEAGPSTYWGYDGATGMP